MANLGRGVVFVSVNNAELLSIVVVVVYVVFRLGIPLNVFLSNDVGNADGFCLNEPVPNWLNFDGLIIEFDESLAFVIACSKTLGRGLLPLLYVLLPLVLFGMGGTVGVVNCCPVPVAPDVLG
ncbi:hypothetical protein DERP_002766 [Dermatophagoides pteronyssinus]|uniref:Transmembrane protein n=1 Tax=Dermatophagoides pteronyssinus TaxID=6956 RepID=A0ABQ8JVU0_DERPT|nr:hypothetical protein DERP_002766 [Dermatophagoides pteronyssinus]